MNPAITQLLHGDLSINAMMYLVGDRQNPAERILWSQIQLAKHRAQCTAKQMEQLAPTSVQWGSYREKHDADRRLVQMLVYAILVYREQEIAPGQP